MLTVPAHLVTRLARLIAKRQTALGTRWRRLSPRRQAVLALAHLKENITYQVLAASFAISVATVFRYVREVLDLLAAHGQDLFTALARVDDDLITTHLVLDGMCVPIDQVRDRRYWCGKHHRY